MKIPFSQLLPLLVTPFLVAGEESNGTAPIDPAPYTKPDCYDSLNQLRDHQAQKSTFHADVFILCPNTVFVVGDEQIERGNPEAGYTDGDSHLYSGPNQIVRCGQDGKSSNNCTVTGGGQLLHSFQGIPDPSIENDFLIEGVTFDGGAKIVAVLGSPGRHTFKDCIFKNHRGIGIFISFYSLPNVVAEASRQRTSFDRCRFIDNLDDQEGVPEDFPVPPAHSLIDIVAGNDDVTITGCVFEGNRITGRDGVLGNLIEISANSTVSIVDSCFIDNEITGSGLLVLKSPESLIKATNIYVSNSEGSDCNFAAILSPDGLLEKCGTNASATTCAVATESEGPDADNGPDEESPSSSAFTRGSLCFGMSLLASSLLT